MLDFTVVVLENAYAASVSATLDILAAAQKIAARAGMPPIGWQVCSVNGGNVPLSSGISVATTRLRRRPRKTGQPPDHSLWIIPGSGMDQRDALTQRLQSADIAQVAKAVARHVGAGQRVAASCSAVFLLHKAGVLRSKRVTTTWWLAPHLQQLAPDCVVDADQMVCADGGIFTAGAAFAQTDLMMYLLRQHGGNALADQLARLLLIDGRAAQAPYIVHETLAGGDQLVRQVVANIESAMPNAISVEALAKAVGMSSRTLSRHIHRVTGKSTMALVLGVKLRKARAMLASSRMTIEEVAAAVGYQDSTALRRMMKKMTGANPGRYRPVITR